MKFRESDCPFMQRQLAKAGLDVDKLTPDQFALWWRSMSDKERSNYDAAVLTMGQRAYIRNLYDNLNIPKEV